jgi:hypothetical protein
MKSPWTDSSLDDSFDIFYDESVEISDPKGTKKTTLKVAPFTYSTGETFSDDTLDTERKDMTFVFRRKDWPFLKDVKRGWTIKRVDGKTFSVSDVLTDEQDAFGIVVTAKGA